MKALDCDPGLRLKLTDDEYHRLQEVRPVQSLTGRKPTVPRKPAKPCNHPGCSGLTFDRYCEKNQGLYPKPEDKRPSAARRKYDYDWRLYRRHFLQKHPQCVNFKDCRNVATEVDHIIPEAQGGSFRNPENHQAMCKSCHSRKTSRENGGFGNLQTSANRS